MAFSWLFSKPVPTIDRFQLENLQSNSLRFQFFDLRTSAEEHALLKGAQRLSDKEFLSKHVPQIPDKMAPIVLICDDGVRSEKLARRLIQMEFFNVFVVEGGFRRLVSAPRE
jgi:rhodanese-related sulfurtransferase